RQLTRTVQRNKTGATAALPEPVDRPARRHRMTEKTLSRQGALAGQSARFAVRLTFAAASNCAYTAA
ncbi:hypothetical protein, partial [Listeria monocytogenes]|uniref:hypothetical protein n=1 Tax=Listeria monocytogenes TaxID=1639 RepID=UPI003F66856D